MAVGWLRQAASNLAATFLPAQARVSALRFGPVVLLFTPGEVMSAPAARWREMGGAGAEVVSLADGYLGYLDSPERVAGAEAHPERFYYGPALTPTLEHGLSLVVGALREADKPVTSPTSATLDASGTGANAGGAGSASTGKRQP